MHSPVEILILGAGWTGDFLIPLCRSRGVSFAATRRAPPPDADAIPFAFDPESKDSKPFEALPDARTVLITFPIKVKDASARLVQFYRDTHPGVERTAFVQLGSTGVWDVSSSSSTSSVWHDRHAPIDLSNARGIAESELLSLSSSSTPTSVLNLSGLWGGARDPKHWVVRVAPTKDKLAAKGSLHMIHGADVARAVLAVHARVAAAAGQRWLLTDGRVYDWWDLASAWGPGAAAAGGEDGGGEENARNPHARWVRELMHEHGVRALPRPAEQLGRALDSREFWDAFEVEPVMARL